VAADDSSELYGLPLEQFVPARTALAKDLRGQGLRDDAKRIAALRKPSVAAWAVNQLVRSQTKAVAELFAAGDQLQRAQAELLAGRGDPGELRAATAREHELVEQLRDTAAGLLSGDGTAPSATTLDRVSETIHAAALQGQAREQVQPGCLERELRHVGLGSDSAATAATTPRERRRPSAADSAAQARLDRERRNRLASARQAEAVARRDAQSTARALASAQRRRDRAAQTLSEAEAMLAGARKEADTAREAHRSAERAREQAEAHR
jgi:hypothetical protein